MRKFLISLCLAISSLANAQEPVLVTQAPDGTRVDLYKDSGVCLGDAKLAKWVNPGERDIIPGCWKLVSNNTVQIVFLDGDFIKLSTGVFSKPQKL